jgi:beta-lactamase regulating signal transducer with metallopeptidase domain
MIKIEKLVCVWNYHPSHGKGAGKKPSKERLINIDTCTKRKQLSAFLLAIFAQAGARIKRSSLRRRD